MARPHIHFIKAATIELTEKEVNAWIDSLSFTATIVNVNVMPMMMSGNLVFVTVITFVPETTYSPTGG